MTTPIPQIAIFVSNILAFIWCSATLRRHHRDLTWYQHLLFVLSALANLAFAIMRLVHWPWVWAT